MGFRAANRGDSTRLSVIEWVGTGEDQPRSHIAPPRVVYGRIPAGSSAVGPRRA
jgi:hypothetical protein